MASKVTEKYCQSESEIVEELQKVSIIVAKSATASENVGILSKLGIESVIVIEATRLTECELIGLLPLGTKKAVLIGDPLLLNPIADLNRFQQQSSSDEQQRGPRYNDMSLMERLVAVGHNFMNLAIEHRMVVPITDLSRRNSNLYPAHLLVDPPQKIASKHFFLRQIMQQEDECISVVSHTWLPVLNANDVLVNVSEARLIAQIVRVAVHDQRSCSIGIVAMSKAQALLIESLLREEAESMEKKLKRLGVISKMPDDLMQVVVGTVDLFQGRSFDVVIVSLVTNQPFGGSDFVARRMRVAATRANQFLLICGHEQVCTEGKWGRVLEDVNVMDADTVVLHCGQHGSNIGLCDLSSAVSGCCHPCENEPKLCWQHPCPLPCHPLALHKSKFNCGRLCNKPLSCGHRCQRPCMEQNCNSRCIHPIMVYMPLCGHFQQIPCEVKTAFPRLPLNCRAVFDVKSDHLAAGLDCRIEHLESVECPSCHARVIAPCGTNVVNIHCIEMPETSDFVHIIHDREPYYPRVLGNGVLFCLF